MEEEKEESTSDNMNGTIILSKPISQTLFESGILDILQDTPVKVQITPANLNETVTIESKVNDETFDGDKIEHVLANVNDNMETMSESNEEEVDYNSPVVCRPPTPPKMSPKLDLGTSPGTVIFSELESFGALH